MKNIIIVMLLVLNFSRSYAQNNQNTIIIPQATPSGIYLKVGVVPSKGEVGLVERDSGNGFEAIGTFNAPTSSAMLYQRMKDFALLFPDYLMVTAQMANASWQANQQGNYVQLLKDEVPVHMLAYGAAFVDTAQHLPLNTKYRIQLGSKEWVTNQVQTYKPLNNSQKIKYKGLIPSENVIRGEWRMELIEQPELIIALRKRIGIDSNFTNFKTDLGYEKTRAGDSLSIHLSDTTVLKGISYAYFLAGKDFLGRVTTHSDTIRSIAGNRTTVNSINRFTVTKAADSSGIKLAWNAKNQYTLRSIRILRSATYDRDYVQVALLPPTDSLWVDKSVALGTNYYYQIVAQGDDDFSYASARVYGFYLNDKRLVPPQNLSLSKPYGKVIINWTYGSFMNLLGFRVYRKSSLASTFVPISDVIQIGRDSLKFNYIDRDPSLNANDLYSYAVAAISNSFQESPLSSIVEINLAQKTAVTAPNQVRSLMLNDTTTSITWENGEVYKSYRYNVFRKSMGADSLKGFVQINEIPIFANNEYTDSAKIGSSFQYAVKSLSGLDTSNLSQPVLVKFLGDKPLPPGMVTIYQRGKDVELLWDTSSIPNISNYNVYRATGNSAPVKIASLSFSTLKYVDKNIKSGEVYFYYLTTQSVGRLESERSREISIRLKD